MGRTGALFAMLKYGVTPDIVCLAKAFGGGMPLGAFASRPEIMQTLQENPVLGHITTFGGHPVCCAAGLAALNYLLDNKVVEGVEAKGTLYAQLLGNHPAVREIRRSGLLLAVELGEPQKLYRIMELFKQAGILSDWFLFCDTGVPHLAAADDLGGGDPRKLGADPQMPQRIGIDRAGKREKRVGNPLFFVLRRNLPAAIIRSQHICGNYFPTATHAGCNFPHCRA